MTATRAMDWAARAMFVLVALLVLGAGAIWLAQRPQFEFHRIELRGPGGDAPRHVTESSIRASIGGRLAGNFFTMRLGETQRLFESVPWVARASVRRVWPDRLVVTLDEHQAIGLWSDGRVLSDRGRLFVANAAEAELDGALVSFSGPATFAEAAALRLVDFVELLAPLALTVTSIEVSDRASWSFATAAVQGNDPSTGLGTGPRFELGRDEPSGRLRERLATIAAAWPMVVARLDRTPARIDARYANGFAAAPAATTTDKPRAR